MRASKMRASKTVLVALILSAVVSTHPAHANPDSDVGFRGWGPRLGVSIDPDQVHFGVHMDFGDVARQLRFQPNFELGIGDDVTLGALNLLEFDYRFNSRWEAWSPYLGGGLGVNFFGTEGRGLRDHAETDVGVNALFGLERGLSGGDRFFSEAKVGLTSSPDLKITLGWTFFH